MKLYRTSVKEDLNVGVVFQHLAENYVNQVAWVTIMVMGGMMMIEMAKNHVDQVRRMMDHH